MLKKSLKKFTGIFATTMIMANTIGKLCSCNGGKYIRYNI